MRPILVALLAALTLAQASNSLPAQAHREAKDLSVADGTALSPGDVLRITVWRKPELSGEFLIAADGSISHPLYRDVRVTGITMAAVESRLRDFLATLEAKPQFVVEPLLRVAVSGEVRQPNMYSLRPEMSLAQAVAIAGGATERGRRDRLILVRQNRDRLVDLRRTDESGAGMIVRSGDLIVVEQRSTFFRDVVAPVVSILGATASIVSVILYNR
jgi:protein involved in polysaccharide export with SLBB domain